MSRLALLLCAIAAPAAADVRLVVMPAGSDHLAELVIINRQTSGPSDVEHVFELGDGFVVVAERMSGNAGRDCCPDVVSIVSMPAGVVADVIDVAVDEDHRAVIRLFRWSGS